MNIQKLRKNKGLSQLKLASLTGVSRFRIQMHEASFIRLKKQELEKLKSVLESPQRLK